MTTITGPINLGNPHEIPVSELADRVIRLTGSRSRIVYRDHCRRMIRCNAARTSPLHAGVLDWGPSVALDDGLTRTIAYFDRMLSERGEKRVPTVG